MITGFFLQLFYALITFMFNLLPAINLPGGFTSAVGTAMQYINMFSFLFPVSTLLTVVSLAITFHLALLTFDFAVWIIHLVRGR